MAELQTVVLESPAALRRHAATWDDLWSRSAVTWSTCRAELTADWVEHFAAGQWFRAVLVERNGRALAAMPLVEKRLPLGFRAAALPNNEWAACGELLLDPAGGSVAMEGLIEALRRLAVPLFWFDEIPLAAAHWRAFAETWRRRGGELASKPRFRVARLEVSHDWDGYRATWSRRHRQNLARHERQLAARGALRLSHASSADPSAIDDALATAWRLEDGSWKGAAGSSVLRTPGIEPFLGRQCRRLAERGELDLALLYCGDRPIAFALGTRAKGVYHSLKIGYAPEFADASPGQVLRAKLLGEWFQDAAMEVIDFQGPMTEAHRHWRAGEYEIGKIVAAESRLGQVLLAAARALKRGWARR